MTGSQHNLLARREFLRGTARFLGLGGLAAGTIQLIRERRLVPPEKCDRSGPCAGCTALAHCERPPAQVTRQQAHGGHS